MSLAYWIITFCAGMLLCAIVGEISPARLALLSWALLLSIVALMKMVGVI